MKEMMVIDHKKDEVRIVNQKQCFLYIKHGLQPLRLECGHDNKLVYVFSREESEPLFSKWRNFELE